MTHRMMKCHIVPPRKACWSVGDHVEVDTFHNGVSLRPSI